MKLLQITVVIFAVAVPFIQALHCWTCQNAESDKDCQLKGKLEKCSSNEESCFTETRLYDDGRKSITRRCKQDVACFNNEVQNPRPAWHPTQCNKRGGSVCRCCCNFDGCNADQSTACNAEYDPLTPENCRLPEKLLNGFVFCETTETIVTCYYSCREQYDLIGNNINICTADNLGTKFNFPYCKEKRCDAPKAPLNGYVSCEQADLKRGVSCYSGCNEGYHLEGPEVTTCDFYNGAADPTFNNPPPICKPLCDALVAPENGNIVCESNLLLEGVSCMSSCNEGYHLDGIIKSTCEFSSGADHPTFNNPPPVCQPLCKAPAAPENGEVYCKKSLLLEGVSCHSDCNVGYILVGNPDTVCTAADGKELPELNNPPPLCIPIICEEQTNLRRVVKNCTNGNFFGSRCQFACEADHQTPKPGSDMDNYCTLDGKWSSPPPCCRVPYPPNSIIDLFIVLDSSSSIRQHNWNKVIQFVNGVLNQFKLNTDFTQAFVMRFNENVDEENQLVLNNNENNEEALAALKTIPYDGKGTKTGKALTYVREVLIKKEENRENVQDVVLLITDGNAYDEVEGPAKKLRDDGVEVFAVGIGDQLKYDQLLSITGNEEKFWANVADFDSLPPQAARKIGCYIAENSCN